MMSRSIVLFRIIDDLARSVGAEEAALSTIKKGVLERQLLAQIIFLYLSAGNLVGKITITVDWDKHQVLAQTEKSSFALDSRTSIAKQISGIFPVLKEHVVKLRGSHRVDEVRTLFYCRPEIDNDAAKRDEAWKFLGVSASRMPNWPKKEKIDIQLKFSPKELREFGIQIEHGK